MTKSACSTIWQILYISDHGHFHGCTSMMQSRASTNGPSKIAKTKLPKMSFTNTTAFTYLRNPYTRILWCFFDKICGIQLNCNRYWAYLVRLIIQKYGILVCGLNGQQEFDQIKSFRMFLQFANVTFRWRRPMDPDIPWFALSSHRSTFVVSDGRYNKNFLGRGFQCRCARSFKVYPARPSGEPWRYSAISRICCP